MCRIREVFCLVVPNLGDQMETLALQRVKHILRESLRPLGTAMGRVIVFPSHHTPVNTLMFNAALFIAGDKVEGDYLEFGVFKGASFARAYWALKNAFREMTTPKQQIHSELDVFECAQLWKRMRFVAFDSFQGLSRLSESHDLNDGKSTPAFVAGKFAASQDEFERFIARQRVPLDRVLIIPGWFSETLCHATIEKYDLRKAAIVHIDCDLYEPTKLALDFVTPLLVEGTVVIFDDWFSQRGDPNRGEQRAWREWLLSHPDWKAIEYLKEGPWRNSFILNPSR